MLLVPAAFLCLCLVMWLYCLTLRCLGRIGFEMETIAFFLSTLSLAVTASSAPSSVPKQLLAVFLGSSCFWWWAFSSGTWTGCGKSGGSWPPGPWSC